jgi:streptomycin 6-kinase
MTCFVCGDWKTIEAMHKLMLVMFEHAELDDKQVNNEASSLLAALQHIIPIHGDLHVGFHVMDAIF